jgi:hypothetical protein
MCNTNIQSARGAHLAALAIMLPRRNARETRSETRFYILRHIAALRMLRAVA